MADKKSIFEVLNAVNVNEHTEKKGNLTYLSWAWALAELFKKYPKSTYRVIKDENGNNYHTDGKTCWVETEMTVKSDDYEHTLPMWLPVMDYRNKSIPYEAITSTDVNKNLMRCLTKNISAFGLGLYIYSGEDLPEEEQEKIEIDSLKAQKKVDKYLDKSKIGEETQKKIVEELKRTGQKEEDFLKFYKIEKWADLEVGKAEKLLEQLETKPTKE